MLIEVITPAKTLYKGEVEMVELPGKNGRFQVLDHHAPLMSVLDEGEIVLSNKLEKIEAYSITSGYVEVKDNIIVVLVNVAE